MSDNDERSVASAGSHGPVAMLMTDEMGIAFVDLERLSEQHRYAPDELMKMNPGAVLLYRQPQPALTDAERDAIQTAAMLYEQGAKQMGHVEDGKRAVALRELLERLG